MSKMKNNSMTPKILALVIAIILWSYVMGEVNPEISKKVDINIELVGLESLAEDGYVILEPKDETVTIEVLGKKSEIDKFSINNISAKADLSNYKEGKNHIPVDIKLVNNISNVRLLDYNPREIVFTVDRITTEEKIVNVEIEGELDQDYILGDLEIEPKKIEITGPKSYLSKVYNVVAKVDINKKVESFNKSIPIEVFDIDGNVVRGLTKSKSMVNVSVPIKKKLTLPIDIKTVNQLPQGYKISDIVLEPNTVDLYTKDSNININSILTKSIDMNSLIGSNKKEVELLIPEGVQVVNPDQKFYITYNIEEVGGKSIVYDMDEVDFRNLGEGLSLEQVNGSIMINLKEGIDSKDINEANIKPYVNLKDLASGEHELNIEIEGIDGGFIKSITPNKIKVNIKE